MRTATSVRLAFLIAGALVALGASASPSARAPKGTTVAVDDADLVAFTDIADSFPPHLGEGGKEQALALYASLESRLLAAVAAAPTDYDLRTRLGDLYRMAHNLDVEDADEKAVRALGEAIELQPNRAEAHAILGIHYTSSARAAQGEPELLAALPLADADVLPHVQIALAFSYYQQAKFAEAARYAGEYLKTHPDSSMAKTIFEGSSTALAGGRRPKAVHLPTDQAPKPQASPTPQPR